MVRKLRVVQAIVCLVIVNAVLSSCGGTGSSSGGGPSDPPVPTNSVSGTVNFKGAPLAGATVTNFLTNSNVVYQTAVTGSNGNYRFTGMSTTGDVPGD